MKPQHIFEKIQVGPLMLHLKNEYDEGKKQMIFWIDLFSGAGGTTTGIHLAGLENVHVVACVNHDHNALFSHWRNHPHCMHFVEDVRDFKVVQALKELTDRLRVDFPGCKINLWASLECTNYSKAKGGLPRDGDSRTLAHALFMYVKELDIDYIYIENVREFMSWGPLDEKGRPISKLNGRDYLRWIKEMCSYGYQYDYQLINSADLGAYTSRERYFGQFAKTGLPIKWPETTHSKKPDFGGLFGSKAKWKPVREVLDLEDEGKSIFTRKKPLSDKTLERIYAGLVKFVAGGEDLFTIRYNGGDMKEKSKSVLNPLGSIACSNRHGLIKSVFLSHYYGNGFNTSLDEPCPTLRTKDSAIKIESKFVDQPWIMNTNFSNIGQTLDQPLSVITANRKWHYLMNPSWFGNPSSIDLPSPVIIARQDKSPMSKVSVSSGKIFAIPIFDRECEMMKKIKIFMAMYGIVDIKMRMLLIDELLKIQGFPKGYKLEGTQTEQKKYIGNAVVPIVAKALVQSNTKAIERHYLKMAV